MVASSQIGFTRNINVGLVCCVISIMDSKTAVELTHIIFRAFHSLKSFLPGGRCCDFGRQKK